MTAPQTMPFDRRVRPCCSVAWNADAPFPWVREVACADCGLVMVRTGPTSWVVQPDDKGEAGGG